MDTVQKLWFERTFVARYVQSTYTAFQDLFADLMEHRHGPDFTRVCPWGSHGDQKCDGMLKSETTLFQVYAPREMKVEKTLKKIDADFKGACNHWDGKFKRWVFVHNDQEGVSPEVAKKLLQLQKENSSLEIAHWGLQHLLRHVRELGLDAAASFLGMAPMAGTYVIVGYKDVAPLLSHLGGVSPSLADEVRPVPAGKLQYNGFTPWVRDFIRTGMRHQHVVEGYFRDVVDPELGERIATAFRDEYRGMRLLALSPDSIFDRLRIFTGGSQNVSAERDFAVLAVLAYFFDRCDIFEGPEEVAA